MPLSLYIHIPFCLHKCSYCDFYSLPVTEDAIPQRQYIEQLLAELRVQVERFGLAERTLTSIFFGGGTPSMLGPALLGEILNAASRKFVLAGDVEITCEANPETLTLERLRGLRAAGINRLSMGVQSFHPRHLAFLERVHSAERAIAAARDICAAGFANVNLDMIYGLPGQTMKECQADLTQAIALEPMHISAYQLTVEERTPLAAQVREGKVRMPDDEIVLAMWDTVREQLGDAGYAAYEISNHARPGYECRHNCNYWEYGEYLGLGTGACSFLRTPPLYALRFQRARNLRRYLAGDLACDYEDPIDWATAMSECAFLALRMEQGIREPLFRQQFGCSPMDVYGPQFTEWIGDGLLAEGFGPDRSWTLTATGRRIANTLCAELLPIS
ncbi:MAG: radical SAM family heme chaperone HemW [Deltaproteobacteria bacterium]|nr:radical SAM family heme chaperone HemW [Deltaproteobacteria bacterium]